MTTERAKSRSYRVLLWALLGAVFLAPIAFNVYKHIERRRSGLPDEKSAIVQLLAQKFSGPQYFQPDESSAHQPLSADKVYLSVASARFQVQRIAAARKLSVGETAKLNDVIARMTEPPPSRVVGDERVNLLLLNISLDSLQ